MPDDHASAGIAGREALEAGLADVLRAPKDHGVLWLIVRRPRVDERVVMAEGALDPSEGLVGDNWRSRRSSRTADGTPHPDMQLTLMSRRAIGVIAGPADRWPLAGDQLYVDFDLSEANLSPGSRLALGGAVVEITAQPHTGCQKFVARFGLDAMKFVNSPRGRELRLRGIYARVVQPGTIRVGDAVRKLAARAPGLRGDEA
jgi:MOSC domain-containing protein YiiM